MSVEIKHTFPKRPIPDPLRGAEIGTFAHNTVAVRIPDIGRRIVEENDFSAEVMAKLEALIGEIPHGLIAPLNDRSAPDFESWRRYVEPYLGQNWLEVPWFFAETYFYRRVLEATGYFQPGPGLGADPYIGQKRKGLETSEDAVQSLASHVSPPLPKSLRGQQEDFVRLLQMNLWGNQADLSLWPVDQDEKPSTEGEPAREARILVNDSSEVVDFILEYLSKPGRIDFVVDNAGLEVVNDLMLADYLLRTGFAETIRFHLKPHPTFVSDAMVKDVRHAVAHLYAGAEPEVRALGARLGDHMRANRLQLVDDFFWTSPFAFWEMPAQLRQELAGADLIVSKGDANYRRLLGDRHWPFTTPAGDVLRYMPSALTALRVCKSEVAVGLKPGQPEELDLIDPDWKVNGEWGMIQFVNP